MKAIGIVRKLDQLGRIVIPMEVRRARGWEEGTPIEMFSTEKGLVLQEYGAEQKRLAVVEELKTLSSMVDDESALSIINDVMRYVEKGVGK